MPETWSVSEAVEAAAEEAAAAAAGAAALTGVGVVAEAVGQARDAAAAGRRDPAGRARVRARKDFRTEIPVR